MDRSDFERMLNEARTARDEAAKQLAALQRRVDALNKMADAAEELLADEPADGGDATPPAVPLPKSGIPARTGDRARLVLQRYPNQYRHFRQVWQEMVAEGWVQDSKNGRSTVRLALGRLATRDANVERAAAGAPEFRWTDHEADNLAISNGHLLVRADWKD